jgi:hypothetical protein
MDNLWPDRLPAGVLEELTRQLDAEVAGGD